MPDTLKVGFYSALLAGIATIGYDIVQVMQLLGILTFPADEILIFGFSLLIVVPFILAILALHHAVPPVQKFWSHAALVFAVMYGVYVTLNYVVQLATVIPAKLRGELEPIRVLDQTPHSLFWDIDALGYIFMGLTTLFAAVVFAKRGLERWVRAVLIANTAMTPVIALVYFYPTFSTRLLLLASPWMVTAAGSMLLLAAYFRNARTESSGSPTQR